MDFNKINQQLLDELFVQAESSERKRMNYDLRTDADDCSQRMLNAMMPGTQVPIHRHPNSNENVILICGKMEWVVYEEIDSLLSPLKGDDVKAFPQGMDAQDVTSGRRLREVARYLLDPSLGNFGCVVPKGVWHTVEVLEPSVIYEAKDGKYGKDGSVMW